MNIKGNPAGKAGGRTGRPAQAKVRITIRLDRETIDWFHDRAAGAALGYQAMINDALREYVGQGGATLEAVLRRVIREELGKAGPEAEADIIPRGRL
jgi:hypothetical protein